MSDQEKTPKAEPATPVPTGDAMASKDGPSQDGPPKDGPEELGGPKGPEPTRFGDWERNGRCSDF